MSLNMFVTHNIHQTLFNDILLKLFIDAGIIIQTARKKRENEKYYIHLESNKYKEKIK